MSGLNQMALKTPVPVLFLLLSHLLPAQQTSPLSLEGKTLDPKSLAQGQPAKVAAELALAEKNYTEDPENLSHIIWYGRRLAYAARFSEAIAIFSKGLERFPEHPELLRHRGHRYLTLRKLEEARLDFALAARKSKDLPIQTELDGQPNAVDIPLANLQRNIYYHWALTEFVLVNYGKSVRLWKRCLDYSLHPEMKISVWDWLYLSYIKGGHPKQAASLLASIPNLEGLRENQNYYRRIQLYKGMGGTEDVPDFTRPLAANQISLAYALSCLKEPYPEEAAHMRRAILATGQWHSFSYLAAEADLARQTGPTNSPQARNPLRR